MVIHRLDSGVRIEAGDAWRVRPGGGPLRLVRRPVEGLGAVVATAGSEPVGKRVDTRGYAARQLSVLAAVLADLRVIDRRDCRLDGRPARRVLTTYRQGVLGGVADTVWCVAGRQAHTLSAGGLAPVLRFLEPLLTGLLDGVTLPDTDEPAP